MNVERIGYGNIWLRLASCVAVAAFVIVADFLHVLNQIDVFLINIWTDYNPEGILSRANPLAETAVVLVVSIIPALPRFKRPLGMLMIGILLLFADLTSLSLVFASTDILLPLASPVVAIAGATATLGFLAWSDERARAELMERLVKARTQFADMLAHDLKKRLSSILMSVSLIEKGGGKPDEKNELVAIIKASSERMLIDLHNLLDIRKMEECGLVLRRERINTGDLIRQSLEEHRTLSSVTGIRLDRDIGSDCGIFVDTGIMSRVLTNLIWNAVQHSPDGSAVTVRSVEEHGNVLISVENAGDVIPAERMGRLFQPYLSNFGDTGAEHRDGTGLGLSFCKLAMEAHGADIAVESPVSGTSGGTKITLKLKRADSGK